GGDVLVGQVDAVLLRQQRISDVVVEAYTHGVGQSLMGYLPGGDALDLPTPRISWQEPGSEGARWLLWHPSACNLDHRLLAGMGQQAAAVQRRAGFGTHQLENGGGQVLQPAAAGPGAWRNAGAAHSEQVVDHLAVGHMPAGAEVGQGADAAAVRTVQGVGAAVFTPAHDQVGRNVRCIEGRGAGGNGPVNQGFSAPWVDRPGQQLPQFIEYPLIVAGFNQAGGLAAPHIQANIAIPYAGQGKGGHFWPQRSVPVGGVPAQRVAGGFLLSG